MTKLTIKTYHSNATVFGNDIWHNVSYDGDTLQRSIPGCGEYR